MNPDRIQQPVIEMANSLTLEDIAALINNNKKEILDKVEGIVDEVKEVKCQVSDLNIKAKKQEAINIEVNKKLELLEKEICEMKKPTLPNPSFAQVTSLPSSGSTAAKDPRITRLINEGKRVIGLSPIDNNDIDIEKQKGIENEAMISAIRTFFMDDMNIPETTVAKMTIVRVFRPASNEDNEKLYVEFENEASVNIVHRYKKNLAPGLRIFP